VEGELTGIRMWSGGRTKGAPGGSSGRIHMLDLTNKNAVRVLSDRTGNKGLP
jgi:hypothetical protein